MSKIILLNKPYGVICQFSVDPLYPSLKNYISLAGVYPAGRLDTDSEGLLILTNNGKLQNLISEPKHKKYKTYWVQVEGKITSQQLLMLESGIDLGTYTSQKAFVKEIAEPMNLWSRNPPVRYRKTVPTSWLKLSICEGKNRQVRKMTAKVGLPTLRLIRVQIGGVGLGNLQPGEWQELNYMEFIKQFNNK